MSITKIKYLSILSVCLLVASTSFAAQPLKGWKKNLDGYFLGLGGSFFSQYAGNVYLKAVQEEKRTIDLKGHDFRLFAGRGMVIGKDKDNYLSVELQYNYSNLYYDIKDNENRDEDAINREKFKLDSYIGVALKYGFLYDNFMPFIKVGLLKGHLSIDGKQYTRAGVQSGTLHKEDDGFGVLLAAGLEYFINDRVAIFAEAKLNDFFFKTGEVSYVYPTRPTVFTSINVSGHFMMINETIGLIYYF